MDKLLLLIEYQNVQLYIVAPKNFVQNNKTLLREWLKTGFSVFGVSPTDAQITIREMTIVPGPEPQ